MNSSSTKTSRLNGMLGIAIEPTYFDLKDHRVEPVEMVAMVKGTGANTIRVGMFSHQGHAYYPSRVAPQAPFLRGRNLLKEFEEACQRQGVNLAVYLNSKWVRNRRHRSWNVTFKKGPMTFRDVDAHTALNLYPMCPCSPFLDYFKAIIAEVLTISSPPILYIDNFAIHPFCRCPFCRRRYGRPIPPDNTWSSPATQRYLAWVARASRTLAAQLVKVARARRPGVAVVFNRGQFWSVGDTFTPEDNAIYAHRLADMVHTESAVRFYGESFRHINEQCAFGRSIRLPVWTWVEYALYPFSYTSAPPAETRIKAAKVMANGGRPMVWNLPCAPRGDWRGLAGVREVFQLVARRPEYFNRVTAVSCLGIVFSSQSVRAYCQGEPKRLKQYQASFAGARDLAIRCHLPYDFVLDEHLEARRLAAYRALVLPNVVHLTPRQCRALERYVAGGGALFATYETSLRDRLGNRLSDFALGDVLGVRYQAELGLQQEGYCAGYARFVEDHPINGSGLRDRLFPLAGRWLAVHSEKGIARLLQRCRYYCDYPQPATTQPAIVARRHGKGRVVYVAGEFFKTYHQFGFLEYKTLFQQSMAWFMDGRCPVKTNLPDSVEVTMTRNRPGALVIHLVNCSFDETRPVKEIQPVSGKFLEVAGTKRSRRAIDLTTGRKVPCERRGSFVRLKLPELTGYNVIILK